MDSIIYKNGLKMMKITWVAWPTSWKSTTPNSLRKRELEMPCT
uniref:Uncharacterized protein n=1 Tax=Anguilla anguilla TaxID=7936 RepID=A0A0E9WDE9_ANGAN